ncbi:MAG: hypothetical protein AAB557_02965 [Patescibacteria group bacterium]
MVWSADRVASDLDQGTLAILKGVEQIGGGIDDVLTGLASRILSGEIRAEDEPSEDLIKSTIDTLIPAMQLHRSASPFHRYSATSGEVVIGEDASLRRLAHRYLEDFFLNGLGLPELLNGTTLVMVAGQQGSGKDSLAPAFSSLGFSGASMSVVVRDVTTAWGHDRSDTSEKITIGKQLKALLGQGILVPITVARMAAQGNKNIVMFGPRVMEEAEAVLDLGGTLIGVMTHADSNTDVQIRRARIVERAKEEPERAVDVIKFDEREGIEGEKIDRILGLPLCHRFVNDMPKDSVRDEFSKFILPLLEKKMS